MLFNKDVIIIIIIIIMHTSDNIKDNYFSTIHNYLKAQGYVHIILHSFLHSIRYSMNTYPTCDSDSTTEVLYHL